MENNIGIRANKERIGILLSYIGKQIPNLTLRKLIKLIFLIDECSVKEKGYPLTWLNYYAWEKGPVAREIYDVKNNGGLFSEFINVKKNEENGKYMISTNTSFDLETGMTKFSQNQIDMIDSIIEKNRTADEEKLTEITHEEKGAWNDTVKRNNISFKDNSKTNIKVDLIGFFVNRESEMYQDYLEAFDNVCFAASLNDQ